jgi:hypothetical protein
MPTELEAVPDTVEDAGPAPAVPDPVADDAGLAPPPLAVEIVEVDSAPPEPLEDDAPPWPLTAAEQSTDVKAKPARRNRWAILCFIGMHPRVRASCS